jgi:hypothetical protein
MQPALLNHVMVPKMSAEIVNNEGRRIIARTIAARGHASTTFGSLEMRCVNRLKGPAGVEPFVVSRLVPRLNTE